MTSIFLPFKPVDIPGFSIEAGTSPAAVLYEGRTYLFWTSSKNDGISYSSYSRGIWAPAKSCRKEGASWLGVAPRTSPCVVVQDDTVYLFYCGAGMDGIFYTTFDGSTWTPIVSIQEQSCCTLERCSSNTPTAIVYRGVIHLFWTNESHLYCSVFMYTVRNPPCKMIKLHGSAPVPLYFRRQLHLAFVTAASGPELVAFDGKTWEGLLDHLQGSENVISNAIVHGPGTAITAVYSTEAKGIPTTFSTSYDGAKWKPASQLDIQLGPDTCFTSVPQAGFSHGVKSFWLNEKGRLQMSGARFIRSDVLRQGEVTDAIGKQHRFCLDSGDPAFCKSLMDTYKKVPGLEIVETVDGIPHAPMIKPNATINGLAEWHALKAWTSQQIFEGGFITCLAIQALQAGYTVGLVIDDARTFFHFIPPAPVSETVAAVVPSPAAKPTSAARRLSTPSQTVSKRARKS